MTEPLLRMSLIGKRFPGVQALDDAGLEVLPGEIHALVGENGAGKSTLGKIVAGAAVADRGEIRVNGRVVAFLSPRDAIHEGIALIHQELALVPADLVGVRSAVCRGGDRAAALDPGLVSAAVAELQAPAVRRE